MNQCLSGAGSFTLWMIGIKHYTAIDFRRSSAVNRFFKFILRHRAAYSAVSFASRITFVHFTVSALILAE